MKKQTLKNRSTEKKLIEINEAVCSVLKEEFDQATMKVVIDTINKLQHLDLSSLPTLDKAREAMIVDITKVINGQDKKGILQRIAGLFQEHDGTIYSALAFGSALKNFFTTFSSFIKAVAKRNGVDAHEDTRIDDIGDDGLHEQIGLFIEKNFRPSGKIFAKYGNNWKQRYLGGSIDGIVKDVMRMTIRDLVNVSQTVKRDISAPVSSQTNGMFKFNPQGPSAQPAEPGKTIKDVLTKELGNEVTPELADKIAGALSKSGFTLQ